MSKWVTIAVSVLGLCLAGYVVTTAGRRAPAPPPVSAPTVNPFARGIAAAGLVEAASRNIEVSAPVGGIVERVLVEVNQRVTRGEALFEIDARELEARLVHLRAAARVAEAGVHRLREFPRAEDLPPLRASVENARARVADLEDWHATLERALAGEAASRVELTRNLFALDRARSELAEAEAMLARAEAGSWDADVRVAEANLALTGAEVKAAEMLLDRLTVRAPIDGVVLKRHVEPGSYAAASAGAAALVLGDVSALHVRARVDEEDAPRLTMGARAAARVRGAAAALLPLTMLRIEPLAAPKSSLTGDVTERVDTRVIDVVFRIESAEGVRVYPGQIVDVYIEVGGEGERR